MREVLPVMILNHAETRALEDLAAEHGIPHAQLMENAGTAAFSYFKQRHWDALSNGTAVVLCGSGNNGGDGFVVARHCIQNGMKTVLVYATGTPKTPDAMANEKKTRELDVKRLFWDRDFLQVEQEIRGAAVLFDGVFGTGFHGELPQELETLFQICNASGALRVALDIPSGAPCKNARIAFQADVTLAFISLKPEHVTLPGRTWCGEVEVLPIGIPEELLAGYRHLGEWMEFSWVKALFPPRSKESNKGTYGKALCVCGSYGMAGAARLALTASCRCGAGLVLAMMPESIYPILAQSLAEPVMIPVPETEAGTFSAESIPEMLRRLADATACLAGCGLGTHPETAAMVLELVKAANVPLVLDADGINALAGHIDRLKTASAPVVLTPHPGEMARLLGTTVQEVQQNRLETACGFAKEYGVILALKGYQTIVALPDGRYFVNPTGNAGMAKGGSGDFLAGMIVAFLAQGMQPEHAACAGVYLHGMAGDIAAKRFSQRGMLPSDLALVLPELFLEIEK